MPLPPTKSLLRRRAAALLLVAAVLPVAATGCGGGDDGEGNDDDAMALIDKAFSTPVKSADVKLEAELKVQGLRGLGNTPIQLSASGPYIGGQNKLPQVDMDVKLGARGQGQSLETGVVSTGDRAYVKFGGEFYEQPKANVDAANRDLAKQKGGDNPLGIDPGSWITGAKSEGDDKVAGVDTTHVSARVDVEKLLADLNDLARKGAGAVGGATAPNPLTKSQLADAAKTVKDPTFDVYVSKDDGTIRRMSGTLEIAVPEEERARANGITGGSLRFTLELADVNGDQKVEAPANARPLSELSRQLGGAAALGSLGGAQGGGSGTTTTPQAPATPGAGGANDPEAIRRYIACINQTSPGDNAARERCRSELQ